MIYKITYIWHDCFVIESDVCFFIFDFWKDPQNKIFDVINTDKPVYIFVSHHHKDHFNRDIFKWASLLKYDVTYIISNDTAKASKYLFNKNSTYSGALKVDSSIVKILKEGELFEDELIKVHAYGSTDIGCSYLINIQGNYIFHAGDLNAWIWKDESTQDEIDKALEEYKSKISPIHNITNDITFAMFPVDSRIGTDFWEGAKIFVHEFNIKHFFPMHFALADDNKELTERINDAIEFQNYANSQRGEYHALTTAYSSISINI